MQDEPIELDEHRGMSAQKDTEIRRRLHEVQADQAALRARQAELEKFLVSAPATTWPACAIREASACVTRWTPMDWGPWKALS